MKKKLIPLFSIIVVAIFIGILKENKTKQSFSKKLSKKAPINNSKQNNNTIDIKRDIASIPTPLNIKKKQIIGDKDADLSKVTYINHIDPKWEKKLKKDLLRFHKENTTVSIKKEKEIVKVKNGKALLLEQVVVKYNIEGRETSYRALVNPENGDVVQTWDRTIHEDYRKKYSDN